MLPETLAFNYHTHSRAFLGRAIASLEKFKVESDVDAFIYAALMLRFGIEARLNEYIAATLRALDKPDEKWSEYVASRLLRRLKTLNPDTEHPVSIRAISEQTGEVAFAGQYTPISNRLASIHGQLGELLHHKLFLNNEHWYFKKPLGGNPHRSLADYSSLLHEGIVELETANKGILTTAPSFTLLVQDVLAEVESNDQRESGDQISHP